MSFASAGKEVKDIDIMAGLEDKVKRKRELRSIVQHPCNVTVLFAPEPKLKPRVGSGGGSLYFQISISSNT